MPQFGYMTNEETGTTALMIPALESSTGLTVRPDPSRPRETARRISHGASTCGT